MVWAPTVLRCGSPDHKPFVFTGSALAGGLSRTPSPRTDGRSDRIQHLEQIMRIDADRKPALAAGQQDLVELQSALVKHGLVMRALPER